MKMDCSYFNQHLCKSCHWADQDYEEQIKRKEQSLIHHFSNWGPVSLETTERSRLTEFRNRAKLSITGTTQQPNIGIVGSVDIGSAEVGSVDLDVGQDLRDCPIHHPDIRKLLNFLPEIIRRYQLVPYQIKNRTGELKAIITYFGTKNEIDPSQAYLRFILKSKALIPKIQAAITEIQQSFPQLVCISANIQSIPHAILEGPEEIFLTDAKSIKTAIAGIPLMLAPKAFVQTHATLAEKLYTTAATWIQQSALAPHENVVELYSGQGAFSFVSARMNPSLYFTGIEIQEDAVLAANHSAQQLGLKQLSFIQANVLETQTTLSQLAARLVLVNPPRAGLKSSAELIFQQKPRYLIYSSCNVETLVEDLECFRMDYKIKKIKIFDLFPHTHHFETLIWLALEP